MHLAVFWVNVIEPEEERDSKGRKEAEANTEPL